MIEVGPGPHLWAGGGGRALRSRGVLLGSLHALLIGSLGMYLLRTALCKALP